MAVRLRGSYKSYNDIRYHIEIHDTELLTDADIPFSIPKGTAANITSTGSEVDPFHPISTTSASWSMRVDSAAIEAFYEDYLTSPEGRFLVRIYYNTVGSIEVSSFIGKLTHDLSVLEESPNPVLSLSAIDPILELETIDLVYPLQSEWVPFRTIILDYMFAKSKTLTYFHGPTSEILHIYNRWRSTEHPDASDILSLTCMYNHYYRFVDGRIQGATCLEALREIVTSLGARIYQHERGIYVIEQLAARTQDLPSHTRYAFDGTILPPQSASAQIDYDNTDIGTVPYPNYTLIAPVHSVRVEQDGNYAENLLIDYTFDDTPGAPNGAIVGEVIDGSDDLSIYARVNLQCYIDKLITATDDTLAPYDPAWDDHGIGFLDVTIRVGSKYLRSDLAVAIPYDPDDQPTVADAITLFWSDVPGKMRFSFTTYVRFSNRNVSVSDLIYTFNIKSPPLESTGEIYFDMNFGGAAQYTVPFNVLIDLDQPYKFRRVSDSNSIGVLKNISDAAENQGTTVVTLINDEDNHIKYVTNYDIGSFPGSQTKQRLKVINTAGELVDSDQWIHPSGRTLTYQEMCITDIISLRRVARRRLSAIFKMNGAYPFTMRDRMLYKGRHYLPLSMNIDTETDTVEILHFHIEADVADIRNVTKDRPWLDITGGLLGSGVYPPAGLGPPSTGAQAQDYYQYEPSISGSSTDVSGYAPLGTISAMTSDSIRASWSVHVASTKYRYRDVPQIDLGQAEFTIDTATASILWPRDLTGRPVEILIVDRYVQQQETS